MNIKPGTYPAQATGHTTTFIVGNVEYEAECETGVRGINCTDTVSIGDTLEESSSYLLGAIKSINLSKDPDYIPSGSYDAKATAGTTTFIVDGVTWVGYSNDKFVKGVDIADAVRVDPGEITSMVLGEIVSVEMLENQNG